MTRWKWDAEPNDPLNEHRIPVTSTTPLFPYVACFHKGSQHRPTEREIRQIRSFIEQYMDLWFTPLEREESARLPFDMQLGRSTVIFHKYGTADWAYCRKTWPTNQLTPRSPKSRRDLGPLALVEVMDLIHSSSPWYSANWSRWKTNHPEVFGT